MTSITTLYDVITTLYERLRQSFVKGHELEDQNRMRRDTSSAVTISKIQRSPQEIIFLTYVPLLLSANQDVYKQS